ncbi:hypothetical protein EGW08_016145 [Elysia chlorotica]|uniref:Uncharacterized protein n=1 Tax=Elysia chlorotica TaxID=188477 RepID=A0A3S1AZG6_ELYCH|nr:hypothetical protein EGW08_016145 [Elysia chlorotica]
MKTDFHRGPNSHSYFTPSVIPWYHTTAILHRVSSPGVTPQLFYTQCYRLRQSDHQNLYTRQKSKFGMWAELGLHVAQFNKSQSIFLTFCYHINPAIFSPKDMRTNTSLVSWLVVINY